MNSLAPHRRREHYRPFRLLHRSPRPNARGGGGLDTRPRPGPHSPPCGCTAHEKPQPRPRAALEESFSVNSANASTGTTLNRDDRNRPGPRQRPRTTRASLAGFLRHASYRRHPEFVLSQGNFSSHVNSTSSSGENEDVFLLRQRVLSESDLPLPASRHPEPDIRRRASTAAAEVRAIRARVAQRQSVEYTSSVSSTSNASRPRPRPRTSLSPNSPNHMLAPHEIELLRRARARGSEAVHLVERMQQMHEERAAFEHAWEQQISRVACDLDQLPVHQANCVICIDQINEGDVVVRLPCMCVFHTACIFTYFRTQQHLSCPIDRTPVPQPNRLPVWRWGHE